MAKDRRLARHIAKESLERGEPLGWFEELYSIAAGNDAVIPWADNVPHPGFVEWAAQNKLDGKGKKALVVGCGLGDDAEELIRYGYEVTAFDISPTAINWCGTRFPTSRASYLVADLFAAPKSWKRAYDLVLEHYTLQVFPDDLRKEAMKCIADFVAPDGALLLIGRGRGAEEPAGDMPWPLTRAELDLIKECGLEEFGFDDYWDKEDPPKRRFRVEYRRPK